MMGGGGRGPAAGPRLRPPLLVAGRGLAARARPAPLPAGPVHPRRRLPSAGRRLRGRGGHAPRSCHLRLALGLADPSRPLRLSRRRNGTTVSVPAGSDPAGRIGWQLSVKRTRYKPQRRESSSKSFIVLLNCFCFLMGSVNSGQNVSDSRFSESMLKISCADIVLSAALPPAALSSTSERCSNSDRFLTSSLRKPNYYPAKRHCQLPTDSVRRES